MALQKKRGFKDFCHGSLDCFGWEVKVVFSTDLGPLTNAVSILSLYPWHAPLYAKGCLLQTFATLCLRALFGINSISEAGKPKSVITLRRSSRLKMGEPEVPNGTEFQIVHSSYYLINKPLMAFSLPCLTLLSLKEFPRNNFQIRCLSQILPFMGLHKHRTPLRNF